MDNKEIRRIYGLTKNCRTLEEAKTILTRDELISYIVAKGVLEEAIPCDEQEERLVKSIIDVLIGEGLSARRAKAILDYTKSLIDVISRFQY